MKASMLDLRRRMREILGALDRGETVTVLYRGAEKGVLSPVSGGPTGKAPVSQHPAFGMWKDRDDLRDAGKAVRELRKGRAGAL